MYLHSLIIISKTQKWDTGFEVQMTYIIGLGSKRSRQNCESNNKTILSTIFRTMGIDEIRIVYPFKIHVNS